MTLAPKRRAFDMRYKQQAVDELQQNNNAAETARRFNVDRRTINKWAKCCERIRAAGLVVSRSTKKRHPGPPLRHQVEDERLYEWFLLERSLGRAVSNQNLASKMKALVGEERFAASAQWLKGKPLMC